MENQLVGVDSDLQNIKDRLTPYPLKLETIPIIGMGGVGKTSLARRLYDDPEVGLCFHIRLWVLVTHEFNVRVLLLNLCQLNDEKKATNEDLAERLYKNLKGRRYLIVMDDIWHVEAWDAVKNVFPDDKNGSRIILTSRQKEVAVCANPGSHHQMSLLNNTDSWKLLHAKVFRQERCPPELEDIGKQIAIQCQGLPLAIVVIAGYLLNIDRTQDCWENVADTVASCVTGDPQQCLDIIALSYNNLPHHLKACFLYFGAFPRDIQIPTSRLMKLWIAEGFLEPEEGKSLEKVAEDCLANLIDRNLILVIRKSSVRIKACFIHDLLRDLCLREAQKEKFLLVMNQYIHDFHENNPRRLSFHSDCCFNNLSTSNLCSLLCFSRTAKFSFKNVEFKLLRVLDFLHSYFEVFPIEIVQLTNLRFLALSICDELPSLISNLLNLQTVVLDCYPILPPEIWKMPQLRHLHFGSYCFLPDPVGAENDRKSSSVLQNIQTLSNLSLSCCTTDVFAGLPNLKKLGIYETARAHISVKHWITCVFPSKNSFSSIYTVDRKLSNIRNVAQLHQLETLKLIFMKQFAKELQWLPSVDQFPSNLKKLTLSFSYLPWENMNILSMLPKLEVLKLKNYAFVGPEWEHDKEGFVQLKYLLIHETDLVHWKATSSQFPSLQHLVLSRCRLLKEVPLEFADILSLRLIELHGSSSAAWSVKQIQQEQENMGNDGLLVRILHHAF